MYKLTIIQGGREYEYTDDDWDFYSLTRALDKREIDSFTVELAWRQ